MEAETSTFIEEEPSCSVCGEIFSVPVVLSCLACGCSFCQFCLAQFWEEQGSQDCPMCSKKSDASLTQLCEEHEEKLTYFCVADLCPVCEYCYKYGSHTNHRVYPLREALEDCKNQTHINQDWGLLKAIAAHFRITKNPGANRSNLFSMEGGNEGIFIMVCG